MALTTFAGFDLAFCVDSARYRGVELLASRLDWRNASDRSSAHDERRPMDIGRCGRPGNGGDPYIAKPRNVGARLVTLALRIRGSPIVGGAQAGVAEGEK